MPLVVLDSPYREMVTSVPYQLDIARGQDGVAAASVATERRSS
ncbi:hypothetical protein AB0I10_36910 [Streptomyces sp. NPDC050636]